MKTINSLRSKLLTLTLALMASVSTFAYEFEYVNDFHINGFAYKVLPSNTMFPYGSAALIEIADCNKDVVIPEFVSYGNTEYRIITIGIGSVVFTNDASSVVESITIPKTTNIINKNVLAGCPNLKTVVVDSENPYFDSRENCNAIITTSQNPYFTPNTLIAGCKTTLIPNSVVEIGENAFYDCESLETITIPNSVTKIGKSAFNVCSTLSSITLSENLTEIGNWAFDDCNNLKEVICYAPQPPTISKYTFSDISPTVYVPENTVTIYQNAPYWMTFDIQPIQPSYKSQWCDQWNILAHGYLGPQEPLYGAKTTIYQLGKDTIINHLSYKQLTRYASDDVNQTKTYVGAIRFAKNNRQVYFYYDNAEYLLYDFKAQVGDTLEVFAGIDNYRDHKTYKHVVTNKEPIQDEQCKVTLDVFVQQELDGEIIHEEKFTSIWIEGVGSPDGIVHNCATLREGNVVTDVLCAYVDDRRMYRTPYPDYRILGCEYNDGDFIEDAFPMLSGLQRTVCNEYCGDTEDDNSANFTYKQTFDSIFFENDKPYIFCNGYLLREEDNKIFLYSQSLNKDIVLYDFTLEVGDSLPAYIKDFDGTMYPDDTLVVTDISSVTLLDGKEYKKWTFDNGKEYVEGIGMYGGRRNGDFFGLIQEVVVPCHIGTHLVCVSKNNKLLYQMDEAEMERLGAECLCDYDRGPRKDNAKDGQIGGRPTPTQWNQLEVVLRQMDNNHTILQAETFIYTLEDISQQVNNKTYFQLARQSTKDTATTKSFVGALHFGKDEDNRVYFLRDGVEYVLYDFTAEIGDTVEIFAGINNYPQETTYTHVVVDKDTTEDGACRMFLEVVFPDETNATAENAEKVWLAGLGSVDGIVHNAAKRTSNAHAAPSRSARSSETESSVMLCAWREDSCLYTTNHPDYETFGCVYNQDPTSVEDISTSQSSYQKIIREGQFLILHNGKTYSVMGIEL